jgi:hypothetical protein
VRPAPLSLIGMTQCRACSTVRASLVQKTAAETAFFEYVHRAQGLLPLGSISIDGGRYRVDALIDRGGLAEGVDFPHSDGTEILSVPYENHDPLISECINYVDNTGVPKATTFLTIWR